MLLYTNRIKIDISTECTHIQDESIVGQVHGEPDAQEADGDTSQVRGAEEAEEVLRGNFGSRWFQ